MYFVAPRNANFSRECFLGASMLDPLVVEERFHGVLETLKCRSGERTGLMRMIEFFEALLETQSRDLVLEYAPTLVVRAARVLNGMEFTEVNISISDRLTPILWSLVVEYPEVGNSGICLAMLHRLTEARTRIEHM
jgi:hypothetical protein